MKHITITFSSQFLLFLITGLLLLNLYYTPLTLICQRQHKEIVMEIHAANSCIKYNQILKDLHSKKTSLDIFASFNATKECLALKKIVTEIQGMDKCGKKDKIISSIQTVAKQPKNQEILFLVSTITRSLQPDEIIKKLNVLKQISQNITNPEAIVSLLQSVRNDLKLQPKATGPLPWVSSDLAKKAYALELDARTELKSLTKTLQAAVVAAHDLVENAPASAKIILPEMTDFLAGRDESREAIFFTETSGTGTIKPRFVCAVESAAKAYPNGDIYLLIAYVPVEGLLRANNEPLANVIESYSNVYALNVVMDKLFLKSPLEPFYKSNRIQTSKYLAAHTSDVIRILAVWNYGGKYFDMDIMTLKNLSKYDQNPNLKELENKGYNYTKMDHFIIQEANFSDNNVANGAFGFRKHHPIGDYMFKILNKEFQKDEWTGNGPRVITLAMRNYTGSPTTTGMNPSNLKEFTKLRYETLFPINFFELLLYFDEAKSDAVMERLRNVQGLWGLHIGNNLIKNAIVRVGSKQPYGLLAEKYCPHAYWSTYEEF